METQDRCLKCGALLVEGTSEFCPKCLFGQIAVESFGSEDVGDDPETIAPTAAREAQDMHTRVGRRFGEYELEHELGRGGMGIVYKARQLSIGRDVALKMLLFGPMASSDLVKRFRMEATSAGALQHPNIVAIHEVGIHDDQHYLVMDYVAGQNLSAAAASGRWTAQKAASLVRTLAEAIHYAHERGILHRDLKPSNILLDEAGQPRITDFGLAKRLSDSSFEGGVSVVENSDRRGAILDRQGELTVTGQVLGSPNYMPPEQAGAKRGRVGPWSDVYSLGAILYHLLTGRPPFEGETITSTLRQLLETEVISPRLLNGRVPVDLETICLKCLQKEPDQRYGTAGDLAGELGRFQEGKPILARPIGLAHQLWRWCRRKPLVASLALVVMVLLLTLAVGAAIGLVRIDRERQRALGSELDVRSQLYTARINSVQEAWDDGHLIRLDQLLEETRASADRGFEWFFWRKQIRAALPELIGHLDRINGVEFSPDGRRIVTGSDDHTAIVWDRASRREKGLLEGHRASVSAVAWFPDNRHLVTGSHDHSFKLWDGAAGRMLGSWPGRHGRIEALAVSPDGRRVVSGQQDGTASIWEKAVSAGDGESAFSEIVTLKGHTKSVYSVRFSSDGGLIVTGSADGTARIWDAATGRLSHILLGHQDYVRSAVFSPDNSRIVTASDDETARVWETATGRVLTVLSGHTDWVRSALISPDGNLVATLCDDGCARLWQMPNGRLLTTLRLHEEAIHCAAFSPDGQWLITGARNHLASLWKLGSNLDRVELRGHAGTVLSVAFSQDGRLIVSGGEDGTVRLWDASSGREIRVFKLIGPMLASFSPDARQLVTVSRRGGPTLVLDISTGQEVLRLDPAMAAAFSPDGQRIAICGTYPGSAKVIDLAGGREVFSVKSHSGYQRSIAYSPDGTRIATASDDQTAKVWNAESGEELLVLRGHSGAVYSLTFSPDGQRIFTGGIDRQTKAWDANTGEELFTMRGNGGTVESVAVSSDGERIVTASHDGTAKVWHASHGALLLTFEAAQGQRLYGAAFSPDGLRLAVAGADGLLNVREAASPAEVVAWEEKEQRDLTQLAQRRQERKERLQQLRSAQARDPGALRRWLMLLPIPFPMGSDGIAVLDADLCPSESQLRPRAGDRIGFGDGELTWRVFEPESHVIDFSSALGEPVDSRAAYAVCYIESERDQSDLRLLVGSDDLSKIYLNGSEVHRSRFKRGFIEDEDVVDGIRLKPGKNVLLFKVINIAVHWKGSVRLTDARGLPVQGIQVSLDPP